MTLLGEPEALEAGTDVMLSDEVLVTWNEHIRVFTANTANEAKAANAAAGRAHSCST